MAALNREVGAARRSGLRLALALAAGALVLTACGGESDGSAGVVTPAPTTTRAPTTATTLSPATTTTTAEREPCRLENDGRVLFEGGFEWLNASDERFAPLGLTTEEVATMACGFFDGMLAGVEPVVMIQELVDQLGLGLVPDTPMMPQSATQVFHPAQGQPCDVFGAILQVAGGVDIAYRGPAAIEGNYFDVVGWCDG